MTSSVLFLDPNKNALIGNHVTWGYLGNLLALEIFVHGMTYLMAPGYMTPFLNHPIARAVFLSTFVWQFIGFVVLYRIQFHSKATFILGCTVFIVFCALPNLALPMLAPANGPCITQAMGPVTVSK